MSRVVHCTMAGKCPEAKYRCQKQYDPRWETYCSRAQILHELEAEAAPVARTPGAPPAPAPEWSPIRLHIDPQGRETYYRIHRGGTRQILASPDVGYDMLPQLRGRAQ